MLLWLLTDKGLLHCRWWEGVRKAESSGKIRNRVMLKLTPMMVLLTVMVSSSAEMLLQVVTRRTRRVAWRSVEREGRAVPLTQRKPEETKR